MSSLSPWARAAEDSGISDRRRQQEPCGDRQTNLPEHSMTDARLDRAEVGHMDDQLPGLAGRGARPVLAASAAVHEVR